MAETNGFILSQRDIAVVKSMEARIRALEMKAEKMAALMASGLVFYLGRVTGATVTATVDAAGNPVAWKYDVVKVAKSSAGYSASATSKFTALTGDLVTTSEIKAYHFAEDMNDGSGVQSTGLDHDPEDIVMQPVPVGRLVAYCFIPVTASVTEIWFFTLGENGEDCI